MHLLAGRKLANPQAAGRAARLRLAKHAASSVPNQVHSWQCKRGNWHWLASAAAAAAAAGRPSVAVATLIVCVAPSPTLPAVSNAGAHRGGCGLCGSGGGSGGACVCVLLVVFLSPPPCPSPPPHTLAYPPLAHRHVRRGLQGQGQGVAARACSEADPVRSRVVTPSRPAAHFGASHTSREPC